jgi:CTP:molybdopterin cytidylyltransferase MocA
MKFPQVRWLTFFSHPANKGNELMLEYNERAAVSRLIIPALIAADHERHAAWNAAVNAQRLGSVTALDELETLARLLPEAINFAKLEESNPGTFAQCRMSFPVLLRDRAAKPVKVRDRALHHLGEVRRIAAAASVLRAAAGNEDGPDEQSVLGHLGRLLRESHASLRDLYEVSTPEVEELVHLVLSDPTVYGARLMGGGFGGNVLALTTSAHSARVIERIQELFYRPRGRDGRPERAVMVSTPGDGLSGLDCAGAARVAVGNLNHAWRDPGAQRSAVCRLLDDLGGESPDREFWPIIVAAGKGARARATGIAVPKPLVPVSGVPSVLRVLEAVYASHFALRRPIIVASPETEPALRQLLPPDGAEFAIQPRALGTGDAVLCAAQAMRDFDGLALVVWGTQPVIRAQTVRRSLTLAALYPEYEMIVPTAIVEKPYAPLLRNSSGAVCGSRETHLEQARSLEHGETNVGLFVAASGAMLEALSELKSAYWRESEGRYDRPGGELGFPNELITLFSRRACGVLACPIADPREQRGVKTLEDIAVCETYIRELSTLEGN